VTLGMPKLGYLNEGPCQFRPPQFVPNSRYKAYIVWKTEYSTALATHPHLTQALLALGGFPARTVFAYGLTNAIHKLLGASSWTVLYHQGGILLAGKYVANKATHARVYLACRCVDGKAVNNEPCYLWPPHTCTSSAHS
jgi:hypothetical protein